MELWPGYVTAIYQFDGGLLLLLDVSHKLLRIDSALDFLYELYSSNRWITKEKTKSLGGRKGEFYTENSRKDISSFRNYFVQKPVISVSFPR